MVAIAAETQEDAKCPNRERENLVRREKGLSRARNARARRGMIQLAWRFLMFQKTSALAQ
jgi:transposase